jgi:hypothetical protein
MTQNPIDVATRVSPGLSELISKLVNAPNIEEPPTLGDVRSYFRGLLPGAFNAAERMHHFDVGESITDELDDLIEEFGEDAPAGDFARATASEPLSRAIDTVVGDENRENPPTLAAIRDALASGLGSRLVGEGALEEDEDDTLLAEIEGLIDQYGEDALAENFLRYE